jgi:perosamine synthetase
MVAIRFIPVAGHLGRSGINLRNRALLKCYAAEDGGEAIFFHKALLVFVDTDPETFLIDIKKIEVRITDRTTAILCGRPYGKMKVLPGYPDPGGNFRMQQSQALILLSQMKRIEKDNDIRLGNALYLDKKLKEIPGIVPYKLANGATRYVYHLYPFRYIKEEFGNVPKEKFIKALAAEGVPCSGGYGPQNKDGLIEEAFNSRGYKRLFPVSRLNQWREENNLPGNDQLCKEAVTFYQSMLLGRRSDMDDIANAIMKIYENRDSLAG